MRREHGRHSCVTGGKLFGNMTIKNLTQDRAYHSHWGDSKSNIPYLGYLPVGASYWAGVTDSPGYAHSLLNELSVSSNHAFSSEKCGRKVRAKVVQRKHKVDRQALKRSCAKDDFCV